MRISPRLTFCIRVFPEVLKIHSEAYVVVAMHAPQDTCTSVVPSVLLLLRIRKRTSTTFFCQGCSLGLPARWHHSIQGLIFQTMKFSALAIIAACYAGNAYAFAPTQVKTVGLQVRCFRLVVSSFRRKMDEKFPCRELWQIRTWVTCLTCFVDIVFETCLLLFCACGQLQLGKPVVACVEHPLARMLACQAFSLLQ